MSLCSNITTNFTSKSKFILLIVAILVAPNIAFGQETIFSVLKTDRQNADDYFERKNFRHALPLYLNLLRKVKDDEIELRIARSYYGLNQPKEAEEWYRRVIPKVKTLPTEDILNYAESLSALGQYDRAINWYEQYLKRENNDPLTLRKIWRLKNRIYLYEDSIHYVVTTLEINTELAEIAPVIAGDTLIFMSNRKRKTLVDRVDNNNAPFFRLYYSQKLKDTINNEVINRYGTPSLFAKSLNSKFHEGPVALYNHDKSMVYSATGDASVKDRSKRTLQLFFAEIHNGHWQVIEPYKFNSREYSITDPSISKDGKTLYFSSNMTGGYGGKDIYKSSFINGQWTKPVNLGNQLNTPGDEVHPFINDNILYFTSNGHAGLGGLDIFKVSIGQNSLGEVQNMGYPINTNYDDFALALNDKGFWGCFTSNRRNGNDDIYEIAIDLQSYPLVISGLLKYKEESWLDSTELKILPEARLSLIDNIKNVTVDSVTSDSDGKFSLAIPYFSQYLIKVVSSNKKEEVFVSLDLSKRRSSGNYEIVVVRNVFKFD